MANLTIYLTEWQKRMVKDYLGVDAKFIAVPIEGGQILLYQALPAPPVVAKHAIMYFTDEQMAMVKDTFHVTAACNHMEIGLDLPITIGK